MPRRRRWPRNSSASNHWWLRCDGKQSSSAATLRSTVSCGSGQKHAGVREIALVLRDLVLQDRVAAKRVPGQLREHAVILVPVGEVMRHDEVRRHARPDLLERILDVGRAMGEVAAAEIVHVDGDVRIGPHESGGGRACLALAGSGKDHPNETQLRVPAVQLDERAAATDLDVVTMRAQAEYHSARG